MHEFSTADGFVEISECLAEMAKYVANEPSVGIFFIQQHAQNAVPSVIKLKNNVVGKSHETTLHMEDLEDSITMVRSMKECGFPIADEMIGEIKKSLVTMTTKKPKRGLIHRPASNFQTERGSFWRHTQEGSEKRINYFSSVYESAKQKASSLKWPQLEARGSMDSSVEKLQKYPSEPLAVTSASTVSSQGTKTEDQALSSQVEDDSQHERTDINALGNKLLPISEKYAEFKATKETKLEEWLEGITNPDVNCSTGDEERL